MLLGALFWFVDFLMKSLNSFSWLRRWPQLARGITSPLTADHHSSSDSSSARRLTLFSCFDFLVFLILVSDQSFRCFSLNFRVHVTVVRGPNILAAFLITLNEYTVSLSLPIFSQTVRPFLIRQLYRPQLGGAELYSPLLFSRHLQVWLHGLFRINCHERVLV